MVRGSRKLAGLRKALGPEKLAERLGVTPATVRRWQRKGVPERRLADVDQAVRRREAARRAAEARAETRERQRRKEAAAARRREEAARRAAEARAEARERQRRKEAAEARKRKAAAKRAAETRAAIEESIRLGEIAAGTLVPHKPPPPPPKKPPKKPPVERLTLAEQAAALGVSVETLKRAKRRAAREGRPLRADDLVEPYRDAEVELAMRNVVDCLKGKGYKVTNHKPYYAGTRIHATLSITGISRKGYRYWLDAMAELSDCADKFVRKLVGAWAKASFSADTGEYGSNTDDRRWRGKSIYEAARGGWREVSKIQVAINDARTVLENYIAARRADGNKRKFKLHSILFEIQRDNGNELRPMGGRRRPSRPGWRGWHLEPTGKKTGGAK